MGDYSFACLIRLRNGISKLFFLLMNSIQISIVRSSRKIRVSISKNKGVETYFDWYQIFQKKLRFLNLFFLSQLEIKSN
jgi:hypothetical protein